MISENNFNLNNKSQQQCELGYVNGSSQPCCVPCRRPSSHRGGRRFRRRQIDISMPVSCLNFAMSPTMMIISPNHGFFAPKKRKRCVWSLGIVFFVFVNTHLHLCFWQYTKRKWGIHSQKKNGQNKYKIEMPKKINK